MGYKKVINELHTDGTHWRLVVKQSIKYNYKREVGVLAGINFIIERIGAHESPLCDVANELHHGSET